jgi:ElaB/YqjD/DUF883 family membrane-anchored ribosome-binding protein
MAHTTEVARDAVAQAAERASEAGRRLAELGAAIQEKARETLRTSRRGSQDYTGRLRDYVIDHPLASIGVALAVGAFLAALLARR